MLEKFLTYTLFCVFFLSTITYGVDVFVTSIYLSWSHQLQQHALTLDGLYLQALLPLGISYLLLSGAGLYGLGKSTDKSVTTWSRSASLCLLVWGPLGLLGSLWKGFQLWQALSANLNFHPYNPFFDQGFTEGYPYLARFLWLDGIAWAFILGITIHHFLRKGHKPSLEKAASTAALGGLLWVLLLSRTTHSITFLIAAIVTYFLFTSRLRATLSELVQSRGETKGSEAKGLDNL